MVTTNIQLCYSPHPPGAYVLNGYGLGTWPKKDIQLWNLMYLSIPELDQYLDGVCVHTLPGYANGSRSKYVGEVMSCLNRRCLMHKEIRVLLKLRPKEFIKGLVKLNFQAIPTFIIHGMPWIETMRARSIELEAVQTTAKTVERVGNVLYAKFGTR